MDHEQFKNNAAAYSLGALDEDERQAFEAHLAAGCAECQALVHELQAVASMLANAAEKVAPPAYLKERILDAIQPEAMADRARPLPGVDIFLSRAEQKLRQATSNWRRTSWGLALALAATLVFFWWQTNRLSEQLRHSQAEPETPVVSRQSQHDAELAGLQQKLEQSEARVQSLQTELAESASARQVSEHTARTLRQELEQMAARLAESEQLVDSLTAKVAEQERFLHDNVKLIDLRGLEPSPTATGRVHLIPAERTAVFFGFDLPQSPAEKDYQLWVIKDGKPVDAGVFNPGTDGRAVALVKAVPEIEHINAFAVTLEPRGGRPQPSGQMYLLGQISGG